MLFLQIIKKSDNRLTNNMKNHYSQPKGFVGRSICYSIKYNDIFYGTIVGGSATLNLPGRDKFFNIINNNKKILLKQIINNVFYHIEPINNKYPIRNFSIKVLKKFMLQIEQDWYDKYKDKVIGFETLIELPRTGEIYKRTNWVEVGLTKGYTCKRVAGEKTESWSGQRVWNYSELRPKRVFCYKLIK